MSHQTAETTLRINSAFGPGAAQECTRRWWFRKFCKDENLEDVEHSGLLWEVASDQQRAILEADSLPATQEVAEEFSVNHSTVIRVQANWKCEQAR